MSDSSDARYHALEARLARVEAELAELRAETTAPARLASPPAPPPPPPSPESIVLGTPIGPPAPTSPGPPTGPGLTVESETVLKWVGVVLVVLAVGFAVSTAISRGWIGPELQLAGAVGLSAALIATGFRLRADRLPWAHALCSGGVAALFTTFASDLFVNQTSTDAAFVLVAVTVAAGFVVSRLVPSEWVGVVALTGALVAWFVIGDGDPPFGSTLALVAASSGAGVLLSLDRGWFGLRLLGHATTLVLLLELASDGDTGTRGPAVMVVAAVVFLSLARVPSIGDLDEPWQQAEVQLAMVSAPWALAVLAGVLDLDDDIEVGVVAFVVAAASGALTFAVGGRIRRAHLVSLLIGVSVCVSIGFGAVLGTDAFFVAMAIQGAGLLELDRLMGPSVRLRINAGVLLALAASFAFGDGIEAWQADAGLGVDLAHLAIVVVLGIAVVRIGHEALRRVGAVVVLALLLIWLGSVLVHVSEGQAAVSVSWAVVGTVMLVAGAVRKLPDVGAGGLAVLALTVGKLLVIDMQEVDALWRAGLFLLVGLGLLRLGFLLPRLTGTDVAAADDSPGSARRQTASKRPSP